MAVTRDAVAGFLDEYLQIDRFSDHGPNGMQVVGRAEVEKIVVGVSCSAAFFREAAAAGAHLLVVHHGLFWNNSPRVVGPLLKHRLYLLFEHDLTLLAYHLPLDAHRVVGNAVQLLARLDAPVEDTPFGLHHGAPVGALGRYAEAITRDELVRRLAAATGAEPFVLPYGPERVRTVAVVTGGAASGVAEAIARGYDVYITGEVAEQIPAEVRESGITYIAGGHYNTEKFGIQALADVLREQFACEVAFLDVPNPV